MSALGVLAETPDRSLDEDLREATALRDEFSARLQRFRDAGMVDLKLKISVTDDTTTSSVVYTVNNALRLLEENKVRPLKLDI